VNGFLEELVGGAGRTTYSRRGPQPSQGAAPNQRLELTPPSK